MSGSNYKKQVYGRTLAALSLVILGLALVGCGKRAAMVDAPDSVTDDTFPRIYPDTATDPQPDNAKK